MNKSPAPGTYLHNAVKGGGGVDGNHYLYNDLISTTSTTNSFTRYIMNHGGMTSNGVKAGQYGPCVWSPYDKAYLQFILPPLPTP